MQTNAHSGTNIANRLAAAGIAAVLLAALSDGVRAEEAAGASSDAQSVERLKTILRRHYSDSAARLPASVATATDGDTGMGVADAGAATAAAINSGGAYLDTESAHALLNQFTRRLNDPRIPELTRDVAPICSVKTRLFDTLIDSQRLSLKPVGKHHYVGSLKLQPGQSTFSIKTQEWEIDIPADTKTRDHLITFYRFPGQKPQLHTFAVDELLASDNVRIPDWLPADTAAKFNGE